MTHHEDIFFLFKNRLATIQNREMPAFIASNVQLFCFKMLLLQSGCYIFMYNNLSNVFKRDIEVLALFF